MRVRNQLTELANDLFKFSKYSKALGIYKIVFPLAEESEDNGRYNSTFLNSILHILYD